MKRFRMLLCGCGAIAPAWMGPLLGEADAELAGLCSPRREPAEALRVRYGLSCPDFRSLREGLAAVDANLVIDLTPAHRHRETVETALAAGCDVFGEKPMADSAADARAMVEAAVRSGRSYSVMQNRRYLRDIRALRDLYEQGAAGRAGLVQCSFYNNPGRGTYRDLSMKHPLLLDMAVHQFDMMRFLFGTDAVAVTAQEFSPPGSWFAEPCAASALFEMENGMRFQFTGSYAARAAVTGWEADWRVEGAEGVLLWDGRPPRAVRADGEAVPPPAPWEGPEGHAGCIAEMFTALREGRPSATDCRDNLNTALMACAAAESAEQGRRVAVEQRHTESRHVHLPGLE